MFGRAFDIVFIYSLFCCDNLKLVLCEPTISSFLHWQNTCGPGMAADTWELQGRIAFGTFLWSRSGPGEDGSTERDSGSSIGILAGRWRTTRPSCCFTEAGIETTAHVERYYRAIKTYKVMSCPDVVKKYNRRMAAIDKSDMVTLLYKTPVHGRGQYLNLFGCIPDPCLCNAEVLYKGTTSLRKCLTNSWMSSDWIPPILQSFKREASAKIKVKSFFLCACATSQAWSKIDNAHCWTTLDCTKLHLPQHVTVPLTCKAFSQQRHPQGPMDVRILLSRPMSDTWLGLLHIFLRSCKL